MGGFHGGHSSGGHSSGGHSGGHSGSGHSFYVGHSNRIYATNRFPLVGMLIVVAFGVFFLVFGIMGFVQDLTVKTTATITDTYTLYDNEPYEGYDFTYTYKGKTYTGSGDDDLTSSGDYKVLVGEEYDIYVAVLRPNIYHFEDQKVNAFVIIVIFGGAGAIMIIASIRSYIKSEKKRLEEKAKKKLETTGEPLKEYVGQSRVSGITKRCPYCDAVIPEEVTKCPNCKAQDI